MIVVEGPDGAGKTTLIERLSKDLQIAVAPKFVKSDGEGSGTNDLFGEAYKDVVTMLDRGAMIYDRHPLISEYIYGPIVRGIVPPDFLTTSAHATLRMMAEQVHVIWCLPALEIVADNVANDDELVQMNGVWLNIDKIWSMYHSMRMWWPGQGSVYDYTAQDDARYGYGEITCQARLQTARHNQRSKR